MSCLCAHAVIIHFIYKRPCFSAQNLGAFNTDIWTACAVFVYEYCKDISICGINGIACWFVLKRSHVHIKFYCYLFICICRVKIHCQTAVAKLNVFIRGTVYGISCFIRSILYRWWWKFIETVKFPSVISVWRRFCWRRCYNGFFFFLYCCFQTQRFHIFIP